MKLKKVLAVSLEAAMTLSMAACGSNEVQAVQTVMQHLPQRQDLHPTQDQMHLQMENFLMQVLC